MHLEHQYTNKVYNQRVVVIGLVAPPHGGISVHVERVVERLRRQHNTVYLFDDVREYQKGRLYFFYALMCALMRWRPSIVHYHALALHSHPLTVLLLIIAKLFLGFSLVNINHTERFLYTKRWFYKCCLSLLLRSVDLQVCIGLSTMRSYKECGVYLGTHRVESAFLPPVILKTVKYPRELGDFLARYPKRYLVNASKIAFFEEQDIYGLDTIIATHNKLSVATDTVGLIIVLSSGFETVYCRQLVNKIENNDSVFWLVGWHEPLWRLLNVVDLFVRPTRREGYSVSVEEALWVGATVVASDCSERPAAAYLFKTGDEHSCYQQVARCLGVTVDA